ncbi:hypothetical protein QAD02_007825 [Eretmocerus hayati]|uniref:Uncharacterized protein n=1 Tax=Eretmocerus hayati TaxID=131215 RepID=A0ACC2N5D8_9HYME|nr:hypothetical protein QAD02_007825 [Eretmocerus hayati]
MCRKQLQIYEPPKKDNDIQESEPVSETPDSQGSTAEFCKDDMNMDVFLGVSAGKKKSWSRENIVEEFGVSGHCAENAKSLRGNRKADDGRRKLIQRKLILCNLEDLSETHKIEYPEIEISSWKFCELCPKQCILAGSSGTHTVCVCVIHENVNLMLEGCSFKKLFKDSSFLNREDVTVNDIPRKMICSNPKMACYEQKCNECPPMTEIHQHFTQIFEMNGIHGVNFWMRATTDCYTISNVSQDTDEFLEFLMGGLEELLLHDFVPRNQEFFSRVKDTLQPGWFNVVFDFAENISFLAQRAIPAFYWDNEKATLFPITIHSRVTGELHHYSYCTISDCLKHDSVAVYMYQKESTELMRTRFGILLKMIYVSDGAPQQCKNKTASGNLTYHYSGFQVVAEWHFFATSHGKGPCDGLAGCIKRTAARASL